MHRTDTQKEADSIDRELDLIERRLDELTDKLKGQIGQEDALAAMSKVYVARRFVRNLMHKVDVLATE